MARLGFTVTGADASAQNIGTAAAHAAEQGLAIDYRATTAEALAEAGERFDMILNMEVVEHVADPALRRSHIGHLAAIDAPLQTLRIAVAAHWQRRTGETQQLQ